MLLYSHARTERIVNRLWNAGIALCALIILAAIAQFLIVAFQSRISKEVGFLGFVNLFLSLGFAVFLWTVVDWMCRLLIVLGGSFQLSIDEANDRKRSEPEVSR
jgi:hypothetical protein